MLGWEFPPAFTGGLGVACYGIVKAISPLVNIHLIVPKTEHQKIENVEIISLHDLDESRITDEVTDNDYSLLTSSFHQVDVNLNAYPTFEATSPSGKSSSGEKLVSNSATTWADVSKSVFSSGSLYGTDIRLRTHLFARLVSQISQKLKFNIIHAHDWPTFEAGLAVKQNSGKPLVLHIHALETDRAGERVRNEIYHLEKKAMTEADQIIAVSDYTKKQIIAHYQIDPAKINVVHNGSERTAPSQFQKSTKDKWIVFIGRITEQKGPKFLLETAEKLVTVYPDAKFVVAGEGDMFHQLVNEVAYKQMGMHFIFTGFLTKDKINDLLASADVYFMPSVSEPFGLSALEAAQKNIPSVISNRSGAAEVLVNTLKADFWDTDRFANYLYALIKYPALENEIKTKMSEDTKPLTWERAAARIVEVYKKFSKATRV